MSSVIRVCGKTALTRRLSANVAGSCRSEPPRHERSTLGRTRCFGNVARLRGVKSTLTDYSKARSRAAQKSSALDQKKTVGSFHRKQSRHRSSC